MAGVLATQGYEKYAWIEPQAQGWQFYALRSHSDMCNGIESAALEEAPGGGDAHRGAVVE